MRRTKQTGAQAGATTAMTHRWQQVLPGSREVLFTAATNAINYYDANIDVISLKTGERKTVQHNGISPLYFATSIGRGSNGVSPGIKRPQLSRFCS